jgi:hypothetical protein
LPRGTSTWPEVWLGSVFKLLQADDSISVGLTDRTFTVPAFVSTLELDGVLHRSRVDLAAKLGQRAVKNPHFTFHPPMYVHLRANGEEELFAGILGVDFIVAESGIFSWIKFVSNQVSELQSMASTPELRCIPVPSDDCSVELSFDYVRTADAEVHQDGELRLFLEWAGRTMRVLGKAVPSQKATLWWNHES